MSFLLTILLHFTAASAFLPVWPAPQSFTTGSGSAVVVSSTLSVTGADSPDLVAGINRFLERAFLHPSPTSLSKRHSKIDSFDMLSSLVLNVSNGNAELQYGVDESYTLTIPSNSTSAILLCSPTQFGALAGLETLSQLLEWDAETRVYTINSSTPLFISDSPAFGWRGLLIDTARHFQSLSSICSILDSMTMIKLNTLHWHIVDAQSWPLESPSWPKLWSGAFSPRERYTTDDVKYVIEYARVRGIRVVFEVDHPGHLSSACKGYSILCPIDCVWDAGDNSVPLAPASNDTWGFLHDTLAELADLSLDAYLHLGGDEVDTTCWSLDAPTMAWVKDNNLSSVDEIYGVFVQRMNAVAKGFGKTPLRWEDAWTALGTELDIDTVIHVWLSPDTLGNVTSHGYKAIYSYQGVYNDIFDYQNGWYLNGLWQNWQQMYDVDVLQGISNMGNRSLVLGGEGAQWGESADGSDVLQTIWPRAAAIGERLWSYNMNLNSTDVEVGQRLARFRCLLLERGVPATPLNTLIGRSPPTGPGSCYTQ